MRKTKLSFLSIAAGGISGMLGVILAKGIIYQFPALEDQFYLLIGFLTAVLFFLISNIVKRFEKTD